MPGLKPLHRVVITDMEKVSMEEWRKMWLRQEKYIDFIEAKVEEKVDPSEFSNFQIKHGELKAQRDESAARMKALDSRLTKKEQDCSELCEEVKKKNLRDTLLDPVVNMLYQRMHEEIASLRVRLQEMQEELNAWKFMPRSNSGLCLINKVRVLHKENEELGTLTSTGRIAKLSADLGLQKALNRELRKSHQETDEFVLELDEEAESMQEVIYELCQQLRESKEQVSKLIRDQSLAAMSSAPGDQDLTSRIGQLVVSDENQKDHSAATESSPENDVELPIQAKEQVAQLMQEKSQEFECGVPGDQRHTISDFSSAIESLPRIEVPLQSPIQSNGASACLLVQSNGARFPSDDLCCSTSPSFEGTTSFDETSSLTSTILSSEVLDTSLIESSTPWKSDESDFGNMVSTPSVSPLVSFHPHFGVEADIAEVVQISSSGVPEVEQEDKSSPAPAVRQEKARQAPKRRKSRRFGTRRKQAPRRSLEQPEGKSLRSTIVDQETVEDDDSKQPLDMDIEAGVVQAENQHHFQEDGNMNEK